MKYNGENTLAYNVKDEEMYCPENLCRICQEVEIKVGDDICLACRAAAEEYKRESKEDR